MSKLVLILVLVVAGWMIWTGASTFLSPRQSEPVACTLEAMVCPDGSTVGRTGPNCEFAKCPEISVPTTTEKEPASDPMIMITYPQPGDRITSPVTVTGEARGSWFFEASFPITVVNWDGLIIGEGFATADGEWMTTEFVPFKGTITYTIPPQTPYDRGALIFKRDNPSGLPENDDAREIPVFFTEIKTAE